MNQKFGDLFAKFLFIFFIWTCIAFVFEIGWWYEKLGILYARVYKEYVAKKTKKEKENNRR